MGSDRKNKFCLHRAVTVHPLALMYIYGLINSLKNRFVYKLGMHFF